MSAHQFITLETFTAAHIPELEKIVFDPAIWEYLPYHMHTRHDFQHYIEIIEERVRQGVQQAFVIRNKADGQVCGMTGIHHADAVNRQAEIGATWLLPAVWGTRINIACKYLMLENCFEKDNLVRVVFRTRAGNIRSQKAIEKTGGVKEGVLRWDKANDDGTFRDTVVYSIILPEWPAVKARLGRMLE